MESYPPKWSIILLILLQQFLEIVGLYGQEDGLWVLDFTSVFNITEIDGILEELKHINFTRGPQGPIGPTGLSQDDCPCVGLQNGIRRNNKRWYCAQPDILKMKFHVLCPLLIILSWVSQLVESSTYVLGNKLEFGNRTLANAGKRSFLHQNSQIVIDGTLISFQLYTSNTNRVRLQAWRPASITPSNTDYVLIGEQVYEPDAVRGIKVIDLKPYERFEVKRGDRLGFTNEDEEGPITYKFINSSNKNPLLSTKEYPDESGLPTIDSTQTFDRLHYPYQFSLSATISTDKLPNEIPGPVGPPGSAGLPGKDIDGGPVTAASLKPCLCGKGLLSRDVILGVIVWLIFLSLIALLVIFILCYLCSKSHSRESIKSRSTTQTRFASENAHTTNPRIQNYQPSNDSRGMVVSHVRSRDNDGYEADPIRHRSVESLRGEVTADYTISRITPQAAHSNDDWPT
ncbi:unnamed protein product [Owenia fusiformis]|uniref:Laminin G domain-containing protein n=1 Tax=Owenia fusiformis TaxID=6347 RepID=A0A8S4PS75_OWEFU|nr:unnamed protein product [Owenia fusiformis]